MTDKVKNVSTSGFTANGPSIILALFFVLKLMTVAAAQKPVVSEGTSRCASLDTTRIHYKSYGKGREAIVLIHGWSCNQDFWRDQISDFRKRSRVGLGPGQDQRAGAGDISQVTVLSSGH